MAENRTDCLTLDILNSNLTVDHFVPQGDGTVLIKNTELASLVEARAGDVDGDPTIAKVTFGITFGINL